jgi:multidrug efflux pump subunit AcrA (membrane-fusion protein)
MKATFRVAGFPQAFPAILTQVSPSVQQDGRTLRVRLEVPNPGGRLKGGLFAEGELLTDSTLLRPALPAGALVTVGREADLFVEDNGFAHRKRVTVGQEQDGWRPVDGLALGTRVVDNGRDQVVEGSPLMVMGSPAAPKKGH